MDFTSNEKRLAEAKFIIVAVPTPVKDDNNPDLEPVENASRIVGRNMVPGTIVVYESTVYEPDEKQLCRPNRSTSFFAASIVSSRLPKVENLK